MGSYKDVGKRLREQLLARGYKRDDGEPDVQRFAWDFRFDKGHLHAWLRDEYAPFKDLTRLCDALDCSEKWLLTGEERKKANPRLGRGRKLLLVLVVGAGLLPSAAGLGETLPAGDSDLRPPSYRKRRLGLAFA